jgi:glycosyltransferase involved in cell wall biosynthesis
MKPSVSLITCTLGRTAEFESLLASLCAQTYRDFEVIIVDQNDDERITPLIQSYKAHLSMSHLRSRRGLSLGRNIGLANVKGDIVAFPDDDCEYPADLLATVVNRFHSSPVVAGICGRLVDPAGRDVLTRWEHSAGYISMINVWRRSSAATIFLRTSVANDIGSFDERLGVGAETPWGAAEETDYLCRAIEAGYSLFYDPELLILHPSPATDKSPTARERASFYGRGMGFVLRKHEYPLWFTSYMIMRPAGGALLDILKLRFASAALRWRLACARANGYREFNLASIDSIQRSADIVDGPR